MSEIIKQEARDDGFRSYVKTEDGKTYVVDSADTFDVGPETMIFSCHPVTHVINWSGLFKRWYRSMEDAYGEHDMIASNIEAYVRKEE